MNSPSSLKMKILFKWPSMNPNTSILLISEAALKLRVLLILQFFKGSNYHYVSHSKLIPSTISNPFQSLWTPLKLKISCEFRVILPTYCRAIVRGGIPFHLLLKIKYFSQIFRSLSLAPPIAAKTEEVPLNERHHLGKFKGCKIEKMSLSLVQVKFETIFFFL